MGRETSEQLLKRKEKEWSKWPDDFLDNEIKKMEKDIERIEYEVKMGAGPLQSCFLKGQKVWLEAMKQHQENRLCQ